MAQSLRDQVFISYAQEDAKWFEALQTHLEPMVRSGALCAWDASDIPAGTDWLSMTREAIDRAAVIVLLVTSEYLAEEWPRMLPLLKPARAAEVEVLWIHVSPCNYELEPSFEEFGALQDPTRALSRYPRPQREELFVAITQRILEAFERFTESLPPVPAAAASETSPSMPDGGPGDPPGAVAEEAPESPSRAPADGHRAAVEGMRVGGRADGVGVAGHGGHHPLRTVRRVKMWGLAGVALGAGVVMGVASQIISTEGLKGDLSEKIDSSLLANPLRPAAADAGQVKPEGPAPAVTSIPGADVAGAEGAGGMPPGSREQRPGSATTTVGGEVAATSTEAGPDNARSSSTGASGAETSGAETSREGSSTSGATGSRSASRRRQHNGAGTKSGMGAGSQPNGGGLKALPFEAGTLGGSSSLLLARALTTTRERMVEVTVSRTVTVYIDGYMHGSADPRTPLAISLKEGKHVVRLVDEAQRQYEFPKEVTLEGGQQPLHWDIALNFAEENP